MARRRTKQSRPKTYRQTTTYGRAVQAQPGREFITTTPTLASRLARLPRVSALAALAPAVTIARAIRRKQPSPTYQQGRGTLPRLNQYSPWNLHPPLSLPRKTSSSPREPKNPPMPDLKSNPCLQRERRKTVLFSLSVAGKSWGRGGPNMYRARRGPLSDRSC